MTGPTKTSDKSAAADKPLTTVEAAEFLGVSKSWLEHRRCDGTGPAYDKYGRLVRYRPEKLREYQEARSRTRVWDGKEAQGRQL